MVEYFKQLGGKPVALFATLGAYPDSQHAADSLKAAAAEIPNGNVVDSFICQGRIDPMMIEWMEQLPADDENAPTDSRRQLWKDAASHPNDQDLENLVNWAKAVVAKQTAQIYKLWKYGKRRDLRGRAFFFGVGTDRRDCFSGRNHVLGTPSGRALSVPTTYSE